MIMDIPSKTCELSNTSSSPCERLSDKSVPKVMCRTHHRTTNAETQRAKDSDIPLSKEILQIPNKGTDGRNSQSVGHRQPADRCWSANIGGNVGKCAPCEVEENLGT